MREWEPEMDEPTDEQPSLAEEFRRDPWTAATMGALIVLGVILLVLSEPVPGVG